ncbi:hemicentin-1-like [Corticium candelabrum]|uniref:hemicentin-1-like n=1 Tax=Corticium candelabrum TaxID=121492 RepID=UPI002E25F53E|nr:hemicentin-1-like [Corticium candelabrum]
MARGLSCLWLAVTLLAVNWITVPCCDLPYYGLNCTDMCGANLTGLAGVIRPPGYDSYNEHYENSVQCEWNIIPRVENVSVVITFDYFLTDSCCDYLSVTDDPFSEYSTELANFRGTEAHTVIHKAPLRLFFYSDGSSTRRAFILRYTTGQPPSFLSQTYDQTVNESDRVLLLCDVTGIPPPVVTWYKNGLEIQVGSDLLSQFELQGNHLLIRNVREEDNGYFQCRAQNFLNETKQSFWLIVHTLPTILFHPTSVHFNSMLPAQSGPYREDNSLYNEGLQAVFHCQVQGYPRPSIVWKKNGNYLYKAPNRSLTWLTIKPVNVSDVGNYTCEAYNRMGIVESCSASLTINRSVLCCLYLRFPDKVETSSWTNVELSVSFQSLEYKLFAVSVAKEGHLYSPATYSQFSKQKHIRTTNVTIYLGSLEESDTAVYSWRLYMSAPTTSILPNIEVTSFIPVTIQGMPRVTVTSSSSFVRNLYGSHIIACFAESLVYAPWVSWFKNDDQSLGYSSINGSNYKITYLFTTNEINVTHYTCSARNSVGIVTNATVSVVVRGSPGGWSWWTDNSLCSVSCGPTAGIRIRRRRCYNQNGCSGPEFNASTCYSYKPCLSGQLFIS